MLIDSRGQVLDSPAPSVGALDTVSEILCIIYVNYVIGRDSLSDVAFRILSIEARVHANRTQTDDTAPKSVVTVDPQVTELNSRFHDNWSANLSEESTHLLILLEGPIDRLPAIPLKESIAAAVKR